MKTQTTASDKTGDTQPMDFEI